MKELTERPHDVIALVSSWVAGGPENPQDIHAVLLAYITGLEAERDNRKARTEELERALREAEKLIAEELEPHDTAAPSAGVVWVREVLVQCRAALSKQEPRQATIRLERLSPDANAWWNAVGADIEKMRLTTRDAAIIGFGAGVACSMFQAEQEPPQGPKCAKCHDNGWHYTQAGICEAEGCEAGPKMRRGIAEGVADIKAGHVVPWEDVKRGLPELEPREPCATCGGSGYVCRYCGSQCIRSGQAYWQKPCPDCVPTPNTPEEA